MALTHSLALLGLLLGLCAPAHAAIECSVDDGAVGTALSAFYTVSTKTVMAWYSSAGTDPVGAGTCITPTVAQHIVGNGGNVTRFQLTRKSATQVCGVNNDAAVDEVAATTTGTGETMHLALVHAGGTITLYKNGVSAGSVASGDTTTLTPVFLVCGDEADVNIKSVEGRLHHVVTFNVAVPIDEIQVQALGKRPRLRRTAATGEWLFDNCTPETSGNGISFRDHSGNGQVLVGNHGTNATGLTCKAHNLLSFGGGIQ